MKISQSKIFIRIQSDLHCDETALSACSRGDSKEMYLIKLYRENVIRDRLKYFALHKQIFSYRNAYQDIQVDPSLVLQSVVISHSPVLGLLYRVGSSYVGLQLTILAPSSYRRGQT